MDNNGYNDVQQMADHQTRIRKRSYEVLGADAAELNSKKWLVNHVGYVEGYTLCSDSIIEFSRSMSRDDVYLIKSD